MGVTQTIVGRLENNLFKWRGHTVQMVITDDLSE